MKTPRLGPTTILGQLLLALAPIVSVPALAEEEAPADAEEPAEGAAEEPATGDDAAPPDEAAAAALEKPVVEETVFVVQGKRFLSEGRFELTPQLAQSVNDQFTSHTGVLVSGLYHLKENVAVEATVGVFGWWDQGGSAPRLGGRETDLTVELRQKETLAPERVKVYQFPFIAAANLQWSPLYGKVNVSDLVLGQFNLYLSVGAGVAGLQLESIQPGPADKIFVPLNSSVALTTTFGGGLRFYFTDWLGVRVEVRDYVIPLSVFQNGENAVVDAVDSTFDVTNLVLTQLGVSFVF